MASLKKKYTKTTQTNIKKIYTSKVIVQMFRRSTLSTSLPIFQYIKWLKQRATVKFLTRKRFFLNCRHIINFKSKMLKKSVNINFLLCKYSKNMFSTVYITTQLRLLTKCYFNYFHFLHNLHNLHNLTAYNNQRSQMINNYLTHDFKSNNKFYTIIKLINLSKNKLHLYNKRSMFLVKYYPFFFYSKFKLITNEYLDNFDDTKYKVWNKYHRRYKAQKFLKYLNRDIKTDKDKLLLHFYKRYKIIATTKVKSSDKKLDYNKFFYSTNRKLLYIHLHAADKFQHNRIPLHKKFILGYYAPRYINYKFLFKNQIREQHTFRWLYRITYTQIVKIFKKIINFTKNRFEYIFFKHFEFRFDMCLYRLNFVASIRQARQWIQREKFHINTKLINWSNYQVNIGDIIVPVDTLRLAFKVHFIIYNDGGYTFNTLRLYGRPLQKDQYINYILINERIPAAIIFLNPSVNNVYTVKPWNIQFITSSLLKYS